MTVRPSSRPGRHASERPGADEQHWSPRKADHPYRADMTYVSPTFGGEAVPWVLRADDPDAPPGVATIQVLHGGLPPMLVVRRADWGWDLQNPHLELQSIEHGAPPPPAAAASEGVRRPPATAVAR